MQLALKSPENATPNHKQSAEYHPVYYIYAHYVDCNIIIL